MPFNQLDILINVVIRHLKASSS